MVNKRFLKLGIGVFALTLSLGCIEDIENYNLGHPMSDKVGFSVSGKLEDGTGVSYKIKRRDRLSFQPLEEVVYKRKGLNILVDYDADGKVDRVLIGKANELIGTEFFGLRLRYNKVILTEAEAKEIMNDADRIFNRVKVALKVSKKLESYSKKINNPFR